MKSKSSRWLTAGAGPATDDLDSERPSNFRIQRPALRAAADPARSIVKENTVQESLERYGENFEARASSSSVMTPSWRSLPMTHVGYTRTPAVSQRIGSAGMPFGSHSTYGRSCDADPNRAFCSRQAGHQYAP